MEMMPVKPERKTELKEYARRHGKDTVTALDDVLAEYLEWERQVTWKLWKAFARDMPT